MAHYCPNIGPPPPIGGGGEKHAVPLPPGLGHAIDSCQAAAQQQFHVLVTYQPASHYWPFQWLELGIYVLLGLMAAGLCFWWVTRRVI